MFADIEYGNNENTIIMHLFIFGNTPKLIWNYYHMSLHSFSLFIFLKSVFVVIQLTLTEIKVTIHAEKWSLRLYLSQICSTNIKKTSVQHSECHSYFSPYTNRQRQRNMLPKDKTSWRDEALSSDGQPHSLGRTLGLFIWSSVYFLFSWDTAAARHPVNTAATQLLYLIIISI